VTALATTVPLLSTKLTSPHLGTPFLVREPLLARLDEGLERKLTLVSAPPGFGKTTLVAEWITRPRSMSGAGPRRRQDPLSAAWVSLDPGDNDPVRFWRYVATACQVFGSDVGGPALEALESSRQISFEGILIGLINGLAELPERHILVLADYHAITSEQVHDTVAFLLDHIPANLHLVILTRSDPPLPLARLRARNELAEVRAEDLRFSAEEAQAFFKQVVPLPLSTEAVSHILARTEGWAAGLRVVALALQGYRDQEEIERFLATFSGSHRPVMDYLVADVLDAQPEPIQEFLLQTAFLNRLSASLCDRVTGRSDSAQVLAQLERANLFLLPLDAAGQWYRYHALFAEAMQHQARLRLTQDRLCELSQRASEWYAEHGLFGDAVEASLFAEDYGRVAALLERIVAPRLMSNEFHTLRRWMAPLPEAVLRQHPDLCLAYAEAILFTSVRPGAGPVLPVEELLRMAEDQWQAGKNRPKLGQVLAFRAMAAWWYGDLPQAIGAARRALQLLPGDQKQWRGISLIFVGLEETLDGRLNAARQTLLEARALSTSADNLYGRLSSTHLLGDVYAQQGELRQAGQLYRQVLAETEAVDDSALDVREELYDRGRALIGLGTLSLEWNDLEAAESYAREALDLGQQIAEEFVLVPGQVILARTLAARGQTAQAEELLQQLVAQASDRRWPLLREVRAWQARLALAAGDLAGAQHWADSRNAASQDGVPGVQREMEELVAAHLHLARGEARPALGLLEPWLVQARAQGRVRSELEILVLQALAHQAGGDLARARESLKQALALAHSEEYRRLFLDEGQPMAALLRDILPELQADPLLGYTRALLLAFAQEAGSHTRVPPSGLVEPLSEQEVRVLRLLAAGLSNPEIADELVVSINTVKTHVRNLYGKLGVHNREEAHQAARELRLL
jgi:LuxR family maltose regulon positive regulatory protein